MREQAILVTDPDCHGDKETKNSLERTGSSHTADLKRARHAKSGDSGENSSPGWERMRGNQGESLCKICLFRVHSYPFVANHYLGPRVCETPVRRPPRLGVGAHASA